MGLQVSQSVGKTSEIEGRKLRGGLYLVCLWLARDQRMKIGLEQSEEEFDVFITLKEESEHLD